jgi:hypothetical protein
MEAPMPARPLSTLALPLTLLLPRPARAQVDLSRLPLPALENVARVLRVVRDIRAVGRAVDRGGSAASRGRAVVSTGSRFVGVPYVWGGSTPEGFDCSGFVQYVYREQGVPLPRTSRQLARAGVAVSPTIGSLREGDLMLFRGSGGVIDHVALYAGRDRILHSSASGNGVRFDDLRSKRGAYYRSHLVAARRVTGDGPALMEALQRIYQDVPFDRLDAPDAAPPVGR